MRGLITLLLFILFIAGCRSDTTVPKTILQPREMKDVLWDIFLAESWARQSSAGDSSVVLSDEVKRRSVQVFEMHQISDKDFFRSYKWYLDHPTVFQSLLDELYDEQSKTEQEETMRSEADEEETEQPRIDRLKRSLKPVILQREDQ